MFRLPIDAANIHSNTVAEVHIRIVGENGEYGTITQQILP